MSVPLVSVVIPTINRPELVVRAANSALAQTLRELEVIVVIDGPDDRTVTALQCVCDTRLRVAQLPAHAGYGGAANAGVVMAQGQWVALLDDDDYWMVEKLDAQVAQARRSSHRYPLVACRFLARTDAGDMMWPRREPDPGEPLCEYLWCQRGLRGGEGALLPSGLLTSRELMREVPFRVGLPRLNDYDWYIRVAHVPGFDFTFVPTDAPLAVYSCESGRERLNSNANWRYCLSWLRDHRELVTPRAYAAFLLTIASATAAKTHDVRAFFVLLREALHRGRPRPIDFLAHASIWLVPASLRTRLNVWLDRRHAVRTDDSSNEQQAARAWPGIYALPDGLREMCHAIAMGGEHTNLEPLRAERGKRSFRATVANAPAAGTYIIKELGPRGPLDATLLQHLRPVPGLRYPHSAKAIAAAGVSTPRVHFVAQHANGPSYLMIMEWLDGATTLRDMLRWLPERDRDILFRMIGQSVARIHRHGVFHFDLNEDNLVFRNSEGYVSGPWMVDLDLTVRASVKHAILCRVLARLDVWQFFTVRLVNISERDRLHFRAGYGDPAAPLSTIVWNANQAGALPTCVPRPRWPRYIRTTLAHLSRGSLLVCRFVC